jgi:Protein kinase domain
MSDWRVPGYAEEAELGRGGSGRVVAARDTTTGDRVAVKYLAAWLAQDEVFRDAFRTEAEILARLDLPHVARVRGYIESADGAAIIMDLVGGVPLRRVLAESGPTSPQAALTVLRGSLQGLAGAHHAGIVHRDYKPENVIVDQAGSSMLVDFGIAQRTGVPGRPAGTPGYAPPEQWEGVPASPSGDIYAAGVTLTECLTGTAPPRFRPPAPAGAGDGGGAGVMGPRLAGLIGRATAADPAARPADATALLAELDDAAAERYGAGWESTGRADLARVVAALLGLAAGAAAGGVAGAAIGGAPAAAASAASSAGPATSATTVLAQPRTFRRAARARGGHGAAFGVAAGVAVAVAAAAGIAVAVVAHHHHRPGQAALGPSATAAASAPSPSPATTPASSPPNATRLSGRWAGVYGGAYSGTFTLRWRQHGTRLHGTITISNPAAALPINGTVHGTSIRFGTVGSTAITYTGTVSGTSMSGTYRVNGSAGGPWHATKT